MTTRPRPAGPRAAVLAGIAGLALALTACGGSSVQFSAGSDPVGTSSASAGSGAVPSVSAGQPAAASGADVVLPEFPTPRVPDLTAMTGSAAELQKTIADDVELPPGVEVTGARCAADGSIVNRSGAGVGAGDDGSRVETRAGFSQVHADGGGQVFAGSSSYQVHPDGSGEVDTEAGTLQVHADGSGEFAVGDVTYVVHADGTGSYTNGTDTYTVHEDGSGVWTSDAYGVVDNKGDGSGRWTGPEGVVEVNGDGTGTLDATEKITVAPMPKFARLGTLPKLNKLTPLGKPCGTLIRISAGVLFDFDKDAVRPEAKQVLDAVAKALATTAVSIQVNGHTDSKGSDSYNQDLSQRRAAAVVKTLTDAGLAAPMQPQGFGETQPVAPNELKGADNPVGRQLNRRVEIVIPNS